MTEASECCPNIFSLKEWSGNRYTHIESVFTIHSHDVKKKGKKINGFPMLRSQEREKKN